MPAADEMHADQVASFLSTAVRNFLVRDVPVLAEDVPACFRSIGRVTHVTLELTVDDADRVAYALLALDEIRKALKDVQDA